MENFFLTLLLAGGLTGLVCIGLGGYLLLRRRAGQTEIVVTGLGRVKTAQTGIVVMVLGCFLFVFSTAGYAQARKLRTVSTELHATKLSLEAMSSQLTASTTRVSQLVNDLEACKVTVTRGGKFDS